MSKKISYEDLKKHIPELEQRLSEKNNTINQIKNTDDTYKSIFNAANDAILITDSIDGSILDVNQKMMAMYGYTYDEALQLDFQSINDGMPPYSRAEATEYVRKAALGSEQVFEWKAKHKNGDSFWVEMSLKLVALEGADRILAVVRDITKRKKADEKIRESEERFRTLTELSHVGTFLDDAQGKAIYINPRCAEIVGVPVSEALHLDWVQYLHPDDRDRVVNEWVKAVENKDSFKQEYRYIHPEGQIVWTRGETTPVINSQGEVSVFIGTMVDITALKQAEQELQQNEALLRELYDNIEIGAAIYETQDDGQSFILKELNRYALETGQVKKEDVIGRKVRDVFPGVVALGLFDVFQEVWKTGQSKRHTSSLYQDDRVTLWVENYVSKLPSGQLVALYEDITDKRQTKIDRDSLEKQLAQAQKIESIGQLAGGVAHDFNNMLGVILGHTELALRKTDPSIPLIKDLEAIRTAAKRSADLTRQLLIFARRQTISPKVLDLNDTVAGMLKMLQRLIGENIHLSWNPESSPWPVKIDPSQLDQILANLCVNARDAIDGIGKIQIGTKNFTVSESGQKFHPELQLGDYVHLSVSDDGSGIDKKILEKVFDPFFTTKEVGHGTGLGLSTVYGAVKQNHGFIYVVSELGQGTTFNIYFPRIEASLDSMREEETKPLRRGTETVLLVEDDQMLLELCKTMLEESGYRVLDALTIGRAVSLAKEYAGPIHLLLSDLIMPEVNGKDLRDKLLVIRPEMKTIFMSGYTADIIVKQGVLEEGIHFLQKPVSFESLTSTVREVLDSHS